MKKLLFLIMCSLLLTSGIAFAEVQWKNGVGFSLEDSKLNFLSTIEVVEYKNFTLEFGFAGDSENTQDKAIAVISYPLLKASDYVTLPIIDLLECNVGIYGGFGRITGSNEFDYGLSATILSLKF